MLIQAPVPAGELDFNVGGDGEQGEEEEVEVEDGLGDDEEALEKKIAASLVSEAAGGAKLPQAPASVVQVPKDVGGVGIMEELR